MISHLPPGRISQCKGVRAQSFVAAENFKGFKMVPPGPHFLSYNAASRSGEFAPTVAMLLHLAGGEVLVRRWSPQQELLLPLGDEDEVSQCAETAMIMQHRDQSFLWV